MNEADFTLSDGRRVLQTADFAGALAALNDDPDAVVALKVTFGRMAGASGLTGDEISREPHAHRLLSTLQDPEPGWRPASVFVNAAIDHGGDLAAAAASLATATTVVLEAGESEAEWHVHTVEDPQFVVINWRTGSTA